MHKNNKTLAVMFLSAALCTYGFVTDKFSTDLRWLQSHETTQQTLRP